MAAIVAEEARSRERVERLRRRRAAASERALRFGIRGAPAPARAMSWEWHLVHEKDS